MATAPFHEQALSALESAHQALDYATPDQVHLTAMGGGAKIVEKLSGTTEKAESAESKGQRQAAAI